MFMILKKKEEHSTVTSPQLNFTIYGYVSTVTFPELNFTVMVMFQLLLPLN